MDGTGVAEIRLSNVNRKQTRDSLWFECLSKQIICIYHAHINGLNLRPGKLF